MIIRDLRTYDRITKSFPTTEYLRANVSQLPNDATNVERTVDGSTGDILPQPLPANGKQTYIHFGLEKAFTGESLGLVHRDAYLRIIELMASSDEQKKLLSPQLLSKLFPENRAKLVRKNRLNL